MYRTVGESSGIRSIEKDELPKIDAKNFTIVVDRWVTIPLYPGTAFPHLCPAAAACVAAESSLVVDSHL